MSNSVRLKELQEEIISVINKKDDFVLMKPVEGQDDFVPTEVSREEFLAFYLAILAEDLEQMIQQSAQ